MKALRIFFIVACIFAFNSGYSQTVIEKNAKEKNIKLPPKPWHMMVLRWHFTEPVNDFKQFDIDVTIDRDIPESYNLYISPINAQINKATFYGGLQTNVNGWVSAKEQRRVHRGKGSIFSRWSIGEKNPIGLEYVDMREGGLCESAGYEGEFCSVRYPFKWTAGKYTLSLIKEETITLKNAPHTWVKMVVTDKNGTKTQIGRLLFEGDTLAFMPYNAAFVEIYSTEKTPNSDVPEAIITFGYPKINGVKQPATKVAAQHTPSGIAGSPNCADVFSEGDNISVYISPNVRPQTTNPITYDISLANN